MLRKMALQVTDYFTEISLISNDRKNIYAYGFEVLISNVIFLSMVAILGLCTHSLMPILFFLLFLYPIRTFCGGYHASSHRNCLLLSVICCGTVPVLLTVIQNQILCFILILCFTATALSIVVAFAPLEHKNNPKTEEQLHHMKRKSYFYAVLETIVILVALWILPQQHQYILAASYGEFIAAITLLIGKMIQEKGEKVYEQMV